MRVQKDTYLSAEVPLVDISMEYRTFTQWTFSPGPSGTPSMCVDTRVATLGEQSFTQDKESPLNWSNETLPRLVDDFQKVGSGDSCYPRKPSMGENLAWGYGSDSNIHPNTYLDADAAKDLQDSKAAISCTNCLTCPKKKNGTDICCGCVNMDLKYGISDICPDCPNPEGDGGPWPGDLSLGTLLKRKDGTATPSIKRVTINEKGYALHSIDHKYPAFPQDAKFSWEGIENNQWDPISRYWGNTSISCSDWSVDGLRPLDTTWVDNNGQLEEVRVAYETEHIFEGQIIGDFFDFWLNKGHIKRQHPMPDNPQPKVHTSFVDDWIVKPSASWPLRSQGKLLQKKAFIHTLLAEIGNNIHLDRLSIFRRRPNAMKGRLFSGYKPSDPAKYAKKPPEDQLMTTKEMGMVFEYMNHPDIWDKFCTTYEAIRDVFGTFDTFYASQSSAPAIPSLQDEWKEYIETVLDSMVRNTKFDFALQSVLATGGVMLIPSIYHAHWAVNIAFNVDKFRFSGTCPHLDSIKTDV